MEKALNCPLRDIGVEQILSFATAWIGYECTDYKARDRPFMNYWGKIIGAATGLALGGVEGSLVGALAGHAVDIYTGWAEQHVIPRNVKPGERDRRNAGSRYNFTLSLVTLGAKLAKADGPVTKIEIAAFKEVFRVPPEEVQNVGRMFDRARISASGYEPYAEILSQMFADNHAMLDEVIGCLFHVALADGAMRPEEAGFILHVSRIFGFSESYFQRKLDEHTGGFTYQAHASSSYNASGRGRQNSQRQQPRQPDAMSDPYMVLGIPASTTEKDIKAKYRKLVRENHPDNLVAAGKSKDAVAQATAKLARINAAYDQISKERHIN
jgi:DnaJ like chaperone protein